MTARMRKIMWRVGESIDFSETGRGLLATAYNLDDLRHPFH
jgi:hypothetical protein